MKKLFFILSIIIIGSLNILIGQDPGVAKPSPSSPSSEVSTQMVDVPVSHFTGQGSVNIPLHTIQGIEGLAIPIQLQYHASGIRVDQRFSEVGLGWNLVAGGTITREVRGKRDEIKTEIRYENDQRKVYEDIGYLHHSKTSEYFDNPRTFNYHHEDELTKDFIDTEPDIFHFQVGGYSGSFFFDEYGVIILRNKSEVKISYSLDEREIILPNPLMYGEGLIQPDSIGDLRLTFKQMTQRGAIEEFIIETPDGLKYFFDIGDVTVIDGKKDREYMGVENPSTNVPMVADDLDATEFHNTLGLHYYAFDDYSINYDWKIKRIETQLGIEIAKFNYYEVNEENDRLVLLEERGVNTGRRVSNADFKGYLFGNCSVNDNDDNPLYEIVWNSQMVFQKRLSAIEAKSSRDPNNFGTEVSFHYNTSRGDVFDMECIQSYLKGDVVKMLDKISIVEDDLEIEKNYEFLYSNFELHESAANSDVTSMYTRKRLDEIVMTHQISNIELDIEPTEEISLYHFDYYNTPLPHYLSQQKDLWGFYNRDLEVPDPINEKCMIPKHYVYTRDKLINQLNSTPYSPFALPSTHPLKYTLEASSSNVRDEVNLEAAQAGSLKSIENQAGATTELQYELNEFVLPIDLIDRETSNTVEVCKTGQSPLCSPANSSSTFSVLEPQFGFFDYENSLDVFENGVIYVGGALVTRAWSIPAVSNVTLDIYIEQETSSPPPPPNVSLKLLT